MILRTWAEKVQVSLRHLVPENKEISPRNCEDMSKRRKSWLKESFCITINDGNNRLYSLSSKLRNYKSMLI